MNASFSIVTPNLNMGKFLQRSMASVIATLVPGDPYFIVDGGSSDNSLDDINSYRPQLTSVISEPDKGYADAIAKGFDQATGSLLCWVNSSDLPLPGALDAAREIFADPAVNLITGDHNTLADTLAAHAEIDALWWPAATLAQCKRMEALSVSNLKRTWVGAAAAAALDDSRTLLEQAVQVKNVWVPYGV